MDLTKFGVNVKKDIPKEVLCDSLNLDMNQMKKDFSYVEVERYLPWFLKYQLKSFDDLILTSEIKKILKFIQDFKSGKGLLLYGSAGSGKTTTLSLISEHFGFELFELNASDARNKKSIEESAGDVIRQKSLFNKEKLILIDEVDGVSGTNDRGGVLELVKLIKISKYPIVFTANDIESEKIKALKKACVLVDFENSSYELLVLIGKKILSCENVKFEEDDLLHFVEQRNTSDIRGFINDLQANVCDSKFELDLNMEIRDYKRKIEGLLDKIYFSYPQDSLFSSFNNDINIDDLFLFLEENTPSIYDERSFVQAFNEIAKADVFRGRIRKWQYFRFLVYVNFYLTFGVSAHKEDVSKKPYKRNQRILKKWIYNNQVGALRPRTKVEKNSGLDPKFVEKLAKYYGCSANLCRKRDIFYFALSYQNDCDFQKEMDEKFGIDSSIKKCLLDL